jgi:hypothetical protein
MNQVMNWVRTHPRLTAWIALALGMDLMVAFEARNVGLQPGQWLALLVATTLVAGLCVWIIGWEDDAEDDEAGAPSPDAPPAQSASAPAPSGRPGAPAAETEGSPASKT